MPFIHIELVEGRSQEQLENMMKDVTEAVHKNTGAPKEHIHVIINEMKKAGYDDEFILEFLCATDNEFVPKSRR